MVNSTKLWSSLVRNLFYSPVKCSVLHTHILQPPCSQTSQFYQDFDILGYDKIQRVCRLSAGSDDIQFELIFCSTGWTHPDRGNLTEMDRWSRSLWHLALCTIYHSILLKLYFTDTMCTACTLGLIPTKL
jgi:hypothetical protein